MALSSVRISPVDYLIPLLKVSITCKYIYHPRYSNSNIYFYQGLPSSKFIVRANRRHVPREGSSSAE